MDTRCHPIWYGTQQEKPRCSGHDKLMYWGKRRARGGSGSWECAVRKRERDRRYSEANREREHERGRKYREANREAILEYNRQYREANRERLREQGRIHNMTPEQIAAKRYNGRMYARKSLGWFDEGGMATDEEIGRFNAALR